MATPAGLTYPEDHDYEATASYLGLLPDGSVVEPLVEAPSLN